MNTKKELPIKTSRLESSDGLTVTTHNLGATLQSIRVPTEKRGTLPLGRVSLRSRYPAALFQAWAWLNTDMTCLVYPKPADEVDAPPSQASIGGGRHDSNLGDDDFAGLRDYRAGDSPRRIA